MSDSPATRWSSSSSTFHVVSPVEPKDSGPWAHRWSDLEKGADGIYRPRATVKPQPVRLSGTRHRIGARARAPRPSSSRTRGSRRGAATSSRAGPGDGDPDLDGDSDPDPPSRRAIAPALIGGRR